MRVDKIIIIAYNTPIMFGERQFVESLASRTLQRYDETEKRRTLADTIQNLVKDAEQLNSLYIQTRSAKPEIGGSIYAQRKIDGGETEIVFSFGDDCYTVCKVQDGQIVDSNGTLIEGQELGEIEDLVRAIDKAELERLNAARVTS